MARSPAVDEVATKQMVEVAPSIEAALARTADCAGDTRFPPIPDSFAEVSRETVHAAPPNDFDIAFVTLRRRR